MQIISSRSVYTRHRIKASYLFKKEHNIGIYEEKFDFMEGR